MEPAVSARDVDGIAVISVRRSLGFEAGRALHEVILSAFAEGKRKFVVDLSEVTTLNSGGVGELIGIYSMVVNRGGSVVLAKPNLKVRDALDVLYATTVFQVLPSIDEAVAALQAIAVPSAEL